MKFIQHKDGSCDIKFSFKERITLFIKGKLILSPEGIRHFGNHLVHMVVQFNKNLNPEVKKKWTEDDEVITK